MVRMYFFCSLARYFPLFHVLGKALRFSCPELVARSPQQNANFTVEVGERRRCYPIAVGRLQTYIARWWSKDTANQGS